VRDDHSSVARDVRLGKYGELVWRRHGVPGPVVEALGLPRGERVLAGGEDVSGRWVVGTDRALYLPASADKPPNRLAWEQVDHADWDREAELLRVTATAPFGEPLPAWTLRFDKPDPRLLQLVRERISASVVVEQHVRLQGSRGVRVIGRRQPAGAGDDLVWALAFDEDVDVNDPAVRSAAEDALAAVRAEVEP
jgi:hypothetical protein